MKYKEQSLEVFTDLIASSAPAPGGGGASAAVGAVGIALGEMVGSLTVGKKKYADVEEELKGLMDRSQTLRQRLLTLIDEDEENFLPLSKAYGIPKDSPGRDEEMERCLRLAMKTPLEIFDLCCELIDIQETFAQKGSRLMISDAATGAAFCRGALYGAAVNVKVNTKMMKDREYAVSVNRHIDDAMAVYGEKADAVFHLVFDQM